MLADLEAGLGTLLRLREGQVDLAFVVVQPSAKSIEVARRGLAIAAARSIPAVLVANRVSGDDDVRLIREELEPRVPVAVVPEDTEVGRADEDGLAPIDVAPDSPAMRAITALVEHLPYEDAGRRLDRPPGSPAQR